MENEEMMTLEEQQQIVQEEPNELEILINMLPIKLNEGENYFDKFNGLKAEMNQMEAMISENERFIADGDDVTNRNDLVDYLRVEVQKRQYELKLLNRIMSLLAEM